MLGFIIALKSKKISKSWPQVSKLLERTLKSICNQTSDRFFVVVVCNEKPDIQFHHPAISYFIVDFPPPNLVFGEQERLKGYEHIHGLELANKNADKCHKLLAGVEYAQQFNPTHLMMMDADDCVSCRLAEWVAQDPNCDGWVMRKGYMHREGSPFVYVNVHNFNRVSGTSVIIKNSLYSLIFKTDPDLYFPFFDEPPTSNFKSLPFVGAVYSMLNGENILMSNSTFSEMRQQIFSSIPQLFQRLLRYRIWFITPGMVREFGLYSIPSESIA